MDSILIDTPNTRLQNLLPVISDVNEACWNACQPIAERHGFIEGGEYENLRGHAKALICSMSSRAMNLEMGYKRAANGEDQYVLPMILRDNFVEAAPEELSEKIKGFHRECLGQVQATVSDMLKEHGSQAREIVGAITRELTAHETEQHSR